MISEKNCRRRLAFYFRLAAPRAQESCSQGWGCPGAQSHVARVARRAR